MSIRMIINLRDSTIPPLRATTLVCQLSLSLSPQFALHFHSATKFHAGRMPVTRRRRLEELSIELRWQTCALKVSNKATSLQGRTIRRGDVYYRAYSR